MLLVIFLALGLPLLGGVLALVAAVMAARHRNPLAIIAIAAISMTLSLFGSLWFIQDGKTLFKSGIATGFAIAFVACGVGWSRSRNIEERAMIRVWRIGIGLSLIPVATLIGQLAGYCTGRGFPEFFAQGVVTNVESAREVFAHRGLVVGHIIGLALGCMIAVLFAVVGSRALGKKPA